jgi:hypothetical protein
MHSNEITVGASDRTAQQQQLVRDTLRSVLDSSHFRRSKRYPAFLEFVVLNTLAGNSNALKERVVAEEVFGRVDNYDPSSDPIVRYTAGEVRKRMALYFSEHPEAPVRIDLPLGGYAAEFYFREESTHTEAAPSAVSDQPDVSEAVTQTQKLTLKTYFWRGGALLVAVLLLVFGSLGLRNNYLKSRAQQEFWWPVLKNDVPALIVPGEGHDPTAPQNALSGSSEEDPGQIPVGDALASTQICNVFHQYNRDCVTMPVQNAKLDDLHDKSVVLIGAFDNAWTKRLLAPYRFQFRSDGTDLPARPNGTDLPAPHLDWKIVDRAHPEIVSTWTVGPASTTTGSYNEYAIVGRFRSEITDGMVVVIAGLGPPGTNGAAGYLCTPESFRTVRQLAPKDWKGLNFEAVLQIDVVQGNTGHVTIVATDFW